MMSKKKNQTSTTTRYFEVGIQNFNRYRRKRPKVNASFFDSALSHTRRSDASEKKREKTACPILDVFACGQISSSRLYRLKLKKSDFYISHLQDVKKICTSVKFAKKFRK